MGVNCGVAPIIARRKKSNPNNETEFVSYHPCDLQTYINYKHPFISTK
jgi:hypothetical protein